jgi:FAD/FMN-containing dehydrogenase
MALPERTVTLRATASDVTVALRIAAELRATHLPLDALAVIAGGAAERLGERGAVVFIRVAGPSAAVERVMRAVQERSGATALGGQVWEDIASLPTHSVRVTRAGWPVGHEAPPGLDLSNAVIYPGSGIAFVLDDIDSEAFRRARAAVESADGALIVERADPAFKRAVGGAWGRPRVPLAIARALKERFDPHGVLAPGRVPLASRA